MQVTDYANGTAPRSALIFFEGMWLSPDLYRRVNFIFQYIRSRGGRISGTEGYRWKGVPNDANIRDPKKTSDGTSNQWFQKGRQRRGETPAAATPGSSQHGYGKSTDTDTNSPIWRDEALRLVGMKRTVASETWHADIVGNPLVDLKAYEYKAPTPKPTPQPVEEDDMPDRGEILNFKETVDGGKTVTATIFFRSPTRGIIGIRGPYEYNLLLRYLRITDAKGEVMFPAETAMLNYYLVLPVPGSTVVDTAFLEKTVRESLASVGKDIKVSTQLSEADMALISKKVNEEFAKRVSS
jgi:hypothetical protein